MYIPFIRIIRNCYHNKLIIKAKCLIYCFLRLKRIIRDHVTWKSVRIIMISHIHEQENFFSILDAVRYSCIEEKRLLNTFWQVKGPKIIDTCNQVNHNETVNNFTRDLYRPDTDARFFYIVIEWKRSLESLISNYGPDLIIRPSWLGLFLIRTCFIPHISWRNFSNYPAIQDTTIIKVSALYSGDRNGHHSQPY